MYKSWYIDERNRQLNDAKFYRQLDGDITDTIQQRYLVQTNVKPGRFYILPKIHKTGNPGRPIDRLNEHRCAVDKTNIKSKPTTVSEHFLSHSNHSHTDMQLIPLEKIHSSRDSVR
ncbi:unnamed protein product, partial [Porites evermanni]